jgi:hypothetical protein
MKKILITLGDSWPQGGELAATEKPYGQLLEKMLNFDRFYNYGSAGASNEDMLYQLQDFIKNHHSQDYAITAVMFLTNPARTFHRPRFMSWEINTSWPADAQQILKQEFLHFHDPVHELMRSSATVSTLQYWCQQFNINDFYFAGWVKYPTWLPGVNTKKIWATGKETAADWFGAYAHNGEHLVDVESNPYITPNFAHPNQLGHQLIADKVSLWIDTKQ